MMQMNPKVNFYFDKPGKWQEEIGVLRRILLGCKLKEELKWGTPCYTLNGANIALIHVFKDYCAVLFFKGALLSNAGGLLIQQTEHVQAARQARFTSLQEIEELTPILKACILEAIAVEKAGLKVELKKSSEFKMAAEFKVRLDTIPALKAAFKALTPGRQRAYLLHFSAPKQAKTREARVDKYMPWILEGKGLND